MLVRLTSVTEAVKIKKILRNMGIMADIVKAPSKMDGGGCGYALKFKKEYFPYIEKTANNAGIKIKNVYDETLGE